MLGLFWCLQDLISNLIINFAHLVLGEHHVLVSPYCVKSIQVEQYLRIQKSMIYYLGDFCMNAEKNGKNDPAKLINTGKKSGM